MIMVDADPAVVGERILRRGYLCPVDGAVLARWGHARVRFVRGVGRVHPFRMRCPVCGVTHVLLPDSCLLRRADSVALIGSGFELAASGLGYRQVAGVLGRPVDTVRGWLARGRENLAAVAALVAARIALLDAVAR